MTVSADALDLLAGDPPRYPHVPGDFHRHPETGAPYVRSLTETRKRQGLKADLIAAAEREGIELPDKVTVAKLHELLGTEPGVEMYGRPSSFGSALDNPFSLVKHKERLKLTGAAILRLDYEYIIANRDNDKILDGLARDCGDAADEHLAADRGTHIHELCEAVDTGHFVDGDQFDIGEQLGIPRDLQIHILDQWIDFRKRLGLTALAVEQTVVNDRWRLAGTLDRLDVADHDILTAYGVLEAGQPFVGDIKTGSLTVGTDGQPNYWVKYPVQLAAYVDAVPYDTETDERGEWSCPSCGGVGEIIGPRPPAIKCTCRGDVP